MTPLAQQVAAELTMPLAKRSMDDQAGILGLINQDLHCFEVSAIGKSVMDAMDDNNLWADVETILPRAFLPSPVTWLELFDPRMGRVAWVLQEVGAWTFRLSLVSNFHGLCTLPMCEFSAGHALQVDGRVNVRYLLEEKYMEDEGLTEPKPWEAKPKSPPEDVATHVPGYLPIDRQLLSLKARTTFLEFKKDTAERETDRLERLIGRLEKLRDPREVGGVKHGIAFAMLTLDLINTPGLIGLRQHDPHRGLARRLLSARSGSYPLQGWSEVVLKHQTKIAGETEYQSGTIYHKCLHFVRSHVRHFRDGRTTIIPAHWRGDPALGIKRTRYKVAA